MSWRIGSLSGALVAATIAAGLLTGWGDPSWYAVPALAVAVAVSEIATVYLTFGRQRWAMSLTEAALGAALVFGVGAWTAVGVGLGVLVAQVYRRRPAVKVIFNVAQFMAATAAAAVVAGTAGGGVPGGLVGMVAFWVVNYLAVALAISLTSSGRLNEILCGAGVLNSLATVGNTSIGLLAAWLCMHAPVGLLALVVPLGLLWMSYDEQTQQAFQTKLFAELARGHELVATRSTDESVRVVLSAASRLFGGDAEIVLLTGDEPRHYREDESGIVEQRTDHGSLDTPWVLRALGARGLLTGVDGDRPFCSAVLGDADHPLAVLIARRPAGAQPFDRREQALAGVMARQAESWLSVAELAASRDDAEFRARAAGDAARALGRLGAETLPALATLRESAARLARLASLPEGPDPVGQIVDELHATEQAVASLLGAVALAAEPGLVTACLDPSPGPAGAAAGFPSAVQPAPARVQAAREWTTTGRFEAIVGAGREH